MGTRMDLYLHWCVLPYMENNFSVGAGPESYIKVAKRKN